MMSQEDERVFIIQGFGDDKKPHKVWESEEWRRFQSLSGDLRIDPLSELVFPDPDSSTRQLTMAQLTDGRDYVQNEQTIKVRGYGTIYNIETYFDGKLVREVHHCLQEQTN